MRPSTAGNNEGTEPFTSNLYSRRVLSGDYVVSNKHLMRDLIARGLWTPELRNQLIAEKGSVQNIAAVPKDLKALYKTVWEIKQKVIIDMAAERGPFICQSQSMNIHMAEPTTRKLTSMHFHAWGKGLKTGMYYLRTKPKADAIQFTVDQTVLAATRAKDATATAAAAAAALATPAAAGGAGGGAGAGAPAAARVPVAAVSVAPPSPPAMVEEEEEEEQEETVSPAVAALPGAKVSAATGLVTYEKAPLFETVSVRRLPGAAEEEEVCLSCGS